MVATAHNNGYSVLYHCRQWRSRGKDAMWRNLQRGQGHADTFAALTAPLYHLHFTYYMRTSFFYYIQLNILETINLTCFFGCLICCSKLTRLIIRLLLFTGEFVIFLMIFRMFFFCIIWMQWYFNCIREQLMRNIWDRFYIWYTIMSLLKKRIVF